MYCLLGYRTEIGWDTTIWKSGIWKKKLNNEEKQSPLKLSKWNTGTSQQIRIPWRRSIFFVTHFRKWNPDALHRVKYFKLYFLKLYWLWLTDNKKPKFQCLRTLEYYIRSIKKDILDRNVRLLKSMFISMYSILGWASFCMNYCINAAWHGDNQSVALFRCNKAQFALIAAFRSSVLLGLVSLIIYSLRGSGQVSLLANQAQ